MAPSLHFGALLLLCAVAQGFFLSLILFRHPRRRIPHYLLGTLILLFTITQLHIALYWSRYLLHYPHFWAIPGAFPLLYGPLLFLYVRSSITPQAVWSSKTLFHFVPFGVQLGFLLPLYMMSGAEKVYILEHYNFAETYAVDLQSLVIQGLKTSHLLVYVIAAAVFLKRHYTRREETPDEHMRQFWNWQQWLILGFGGLSALWYIYSIAIFFDLPYSLTIDHIITFSAAFFIYALGYLAFRRPEVISTDFAGYQRRKYEKSALPAELAEKYAGKLRRMMEADSLYLNGDLTLHKLAEALAISAHNLSQVLNRHLQTNFFDFVNQYRVKKALQMLGDPANRHLTILGIALASGFNNSTSFYTAFKKHTGMTPAHYRKSLRV